jgi:hypothetical protein
MVFVCFNVSVLVTVGVRVSLINPFDQSSHDETKPSLSLSNQVLNIIFALHLVGVHSSLTVQRVLEPVGGVIAIRGDAR